TRTESDMVSRRDWTVQWWDRLGEKYELVTSEAVIDELQSGNHPARDECLRLIEKVSVLPATERLSEIVTAYVRHRVMPADPVGDALHLAFASYYRCDYLVTWNCRHLANANKFEHIRIVNAMLGLFVPNLVTPLELLSEEESDER
ncbi:MAG: hypothetical protein A3I06_14860, partial [Candidatus Lindowbacteria bacterium RIFCSPLOWO2_02_FULL_62_12]